MSSYIIVEVHIYIAEPVRPALNFCGPLLQNMIGIIPRIATTGSVKTNIREICGQLLRPGERMPIVDAQGNIVLLQQVINFTPVPGIVAEFDSIGMLLR